MLLRGNSPKVSILTTVYNREKYIAACIESVLSSTFQDWEMIIVDDCSTDNSVFIAKEFEKKDSRIKVFVNETNLGDYPNRNMAANLAIGYYLKYLDADDIIYPHGLQVMVEAMEKFPEANLGTQYNVREYKSPYPLLINGREAFHEHYFGNSYFQSGPSGTIIKRDAFIKAGGFSGRRHIGDTELWMKLSLAGPIVLFQPSLIWWRQHDDQEMIKELKNPEIQFERLMFDIEQLKSNRGFFMDHDFKVAYMKKKQHMARYILSLALIRKKFITSWDLYKKSDLSYADLLKGFMKYV